MKAQKAESDAQSPWVLEFWKTYCEAKIPYPRYKFQRNRKVALELVCLMAGGRILEVGCGYGRISQAFVQPARIRSVGVNVNQAMLRLARCGGPTAGHRVAA